MTEGGGTTSSRILIFGGTFDPPHLAHARLPRIVADRLGCDEVLYIPAAVNPLKANGPSAGKDHRIAMLVLALSDSPGARISTIELERPGPSYTVETLRRLNKQFGRSNVQQPTLFLLMGSDQALDFHRWKEWREILTLATPVVMLRPPWTEESFRAELAKRFPPEEADQWKSWTIFPSDGLPLLDISATEIRRRLAADESLDGLLDPAVASYIRANKLYDANSKRIAQLD